ncbi:hypothetical protein [Streptomyces sp. NPDC002187]|uniref:hypothetical protein n=1 Tax=Streptomyces sp. NPDC002187 TaxID=3364637 RepID=UPI0036A91753
MPTPQSERAVSAQYDESADVRRQRMARLLADMVPGATVIRVSQREPSQTWPSPYARAYDEHGHRMETNRAQGLIAARWIMRSYPGVSWDEAHDLDLTTGVLKPAAQAYASAGGVR